MGALISICGITRVLICTTQQTVDTAVQTNQGNARSGDSKNDRKKHFEAIVKQMAWQEGRNEQHTYKSFRAILGLVNLLPIRQLRDEVVDLRFMNAVMLLPAFPWMMWMLQSQLLESSLQANTAVKLT
jgi:hypothetical protein